MVQIAQGVPQFSGNINYTPTLLNNTNLTVNSCWWRREGGYMILESLITWQAAGSGAGNFTFGLPAGYLIDTARLVGGTGTTNQLSSNVGYSTYWNAGGSWSVIHTKFATTSTLVFHAGGAYLVGTTFTTNYSLQVSAKVPIVGWE